MNTAVNTAVNTVLKADTALREELEPPIFCSIPERHWRKEETYSSLSLSFILALRL